MWLLMNKFIPRHYYILYNLYESYIDSLLKLYFSFIDPIVDTSNLLTDEKWEEV